MSRNLRAFQVEALQRVAQQNLYLAAKPGSGKTAVAVHAAHRALYDTFTARRVLVVTPKRVVPQFASEAASWKLPLTFAECMGGEPQRLDALATASDVLVTSHEHFPWLCRAIPARQWDFDLVVFDEAGRLKDHKSTGFKAMRAIMKKRKPRLLLMSGSPRPGSAHELFAPVTLLDGGARLGTTLGPFRAAYLEPHKVDRNTGRVFSWRLRQGMEGALYGRIADLYYAVSPDLGLEYTEIDVPVTLPPAVRQEINRMLTGLTADWGLDEITAGNNAVAIGKALQLASGTVFNDGGGVTHVHDTKIDALRELIEQMDGEPLMVATWWTHERERLLQAFPGMVDITTEGGLAAAKAGKAPLALIHPQSAGHGIDGLQHHYSALAYYTLPHSYDYYNQLLRRIVRSGQTETVRVFRLLAGPDVRVRDSLQVKMAGQEGFYDFLTG